MLPFLSETLHERLFKFTAGQDVDVLVDRFRRDPHIFPFRIFLVEALGDLIGRPALFKALNHIGSQFRVLAELAMTEMTGGSRAFCTPCSTRRTICRTPSVRSYFTQDGTCRPLQAFGNGGVAIASSKATTDFFSFLVCLLDGHT